MKKSLIALAALAAVTAASAQSSTTISGGVILGVGTSITPGTAATPVATDSGMEIVRQTGNIAFKTTEDLGGGLKANFEIQTSIGSYATTNLAGQNKSTIITTLGDRGLYANLTGGFGSVTIGRTASAIRSLFGAMGDTTTLPVLTGLSTSAGAPVSTSSTATNTADSVGRAIYGDAYVNNVSYTSPSMSGFQVSVAAAPVEDTATIGYVDGASYSAMYSNGPLSAAVNLTTSGAAATVTTGYSTTSYKITTGLVSYDFGVAKVGFATQSVALPTGTDPGVGTTLTVSAPLAGGVVALHYGKRAASASTDTRFGDDMKQTAIGYRYNLSKRTSVSAVHNTIDRNASTGATANDVKETHIFVGHTF